MKKLLSLVLLLAAATFTSCEKCADCTTTVTTTVNVPVTGYPQTSKTTFEACDDDLEDVDGKTVTSTSSVGNITATATARTTCVAK